MTPAAPPESNAELFLEVSGMHCASCAASVQKAIEARPGVESASVNVTQGRAIIIGADLDEQAIIAAVRDRGFEAQSANLAPDPKSMRTDIEQRQASAARRWGVRAIIGLAIWAPMEILHWSLASMHLSWMPWLMFVGSTVVIVAVGGGFYRSAFNAARRGATNMDTLIAIGATTAYTYSLIVFIAKLFGHMAEQPLYFTEAAALLGIISLGHWLEARATARAGSAVRELLELQPDQAERIDDDGAPQTIHSADIAEGDRILIRPGSRVPVDGQVIEGESEIDEAVVTGESAPVLRRAGDPVIAGSMNTTGRLLVEAAVDGRHTTVARIAEMVQRAQSSKANIQRLADTVSSVFVPTVLTIAAVTFLGWWLIGDDPAKAVISAVTVLIISCPCALGLATPMAVMVGAGEASRRGILVKSAAALERAGRANHVVFDKTGTLTIGRPIVTEIKTLDASLNDNELLRLAASVEAPSEHSIGRAIVDEARHRDIELADVSSFSAIPGQGVRGIVEGRDIEVVRDADATCKVIIDGQTRGAINVEDDLRPDAVDAVNRLRSMDVTVTMLTGDDARKAASIGATLGLDEASIEAEATPESKTAFIDALQQPVVMVGDGINDAAALATADLGIAMASGTNIAIESADVVIPGDRVGAVADTIDLARQTLRAIRQNLFFAFFYNAVAIPVAALGLLGTAGPLWAAAAMGLSDVTVIGNAIRLKARLGRNRN